MRTFGEVAKDAAKKAGKKAVDAAVKKPAKKAATTVTTTAKRGYSAAVKPKAVISTNEQVKAAHCGGCKKPLDGRKHNKSACLKAEARQMFREHGIDY